MNVQPNVYVSASTRLSVPPEPHTRVWVVFFGNGVISDVGKGGDANHNAWCVRGGSGVDPQ
jgi:hypothetical protein